MVGSRVIPYYVVVARKPCVSTVRVAREVDKVDGRVLGLKLVQGAEVSFYLFLSIPRCFLA
jgi:hypothetical protein